MATWMGTGIATGEQSESAATAVAAVEQAIGNMGHLDEIKLCIVYANTDYDLEQVVHAINEVTGNTPLIGCSTTGEFMSERVEVGAVVVTTIASDQFEVQIGSSTGYSADIPAAVNSAMNGFVAISEDRQLRPGWRGRTLLLYTDGLAGYGEDLIDELGAQSGMQYQLFGGAAADNAQFQKTFVFYNDKVLTDTFVVAEILTEKPFAIAAEHGWAKADGPYRVTRAEANIVQELNGRPAWEIYQEFADNHDLPNPKGEESSFLMQYILGVVDDYSDKAKLRVPLGLNPDGSLLCAAEIAEGDIVHIMTSSDNIDIISGGRLAVNKAKASIAPSEVAGALVFECVATRLHLDDRFAEQVQQTARAVESPQVMGCACFGQLARTHDDFNGQGCATSLVCLVPN